MTFNECGVRITDKAFQSLEGCLREYPVKTARDIQHVVGVITYAASAFEWPDRVPSPEFCDIKAALVAIQQENARRLPQVWREQFPAKRERLLELMKNRPYAWARVCRYRSSVTSL